MKTKTKLKKLLKTPNIILLTAGLIVLLLVLCVAFGHSERYDMAKWECKKVNQNMPAEWGTLNCSCYAECVEELSGGRKFLPVDVEPCLMSCYEFNRNFL